ncbi:hypothetical protein [Kitasatospora sp. NPDC008115]|uniref:hypothetical protein n=1 Tax=Kitasatospora sp. NPDC008115 TaxID=3364022 RepID=UPI0036EE0ABC
MAAGRLAAGLDEGHRFAEPSAEPIAAACSRGDTGSGPVSPDVRPACAADPAGRCHRRSQDGGGHAGEVLGVHRRQGDVTERAAAQVTAREAGADRGAGAVAEIGSTR